MTQKQWNKRLQKAMNEAGASPKFGETGTFGARTEAESDNYDFTVVAKRKPVVAQPKPASGTYFGAPWIGANIDLLGRHESDAALNARYVPEWKLEGLPGYKSLEGNARAWCSVKVNADLRKVGIKGTNSAGAYSWSKWGRKCPFWFGAVLDIKHRSGGRHVSFFLYWIDEKKKLAACYGGNQSNRMSIVAQTINSTGDVLVAGPRWPSDYPDGLALSKAEVLAKYPHLKVGGSAGSTR